MFPATWRSVSFSDVCLLNPAFDSNNISKDTNVSFVPMSAIDETTGEITKADVRQYKEVAKGYTAFKENDVLFAKITPCMENGKVAIARELINGIGFGSTEFHVLRPTEHILKEYLFFFLRQPRFRKRAKSAFTGSAGQLRVPESFFIRTRIPLPTLGEQERIVAILKQADEIRRLRLETAEETQKLYSALFLEMFGDPTSNDKHFKTIRLDRLGALDRGQSRHRPRDAAFLFGGVYPFIQTGDVANSDGWITNYSQTYSDAGLAQSRLWPRGTLCITIAANIAKTGILTFDACFPDSVVGFMPSQHVTSEYIMFVLNFLQSAIEARAPKGAQMNINLQVLNSLLIPVPPKIVQQKFTDSVLGIRNEKELMNSSMQEIDVLTKSLVSEGFSGKLTAAWREGHKKQLEAVASIHDKILVTERVKVAIKESVPEHRPWMAQTDRMWVKDQMSELQFDVWTAMRKWKGTLIPSEHLDEFMATWPTEHLENAKEQVRRALEQLAGLGLIAKISLPNEDGEYVTGFRGFREDEFSRMADLEVLGEI
ncbi:MAG: EcoKI restriction-modification system protein HsdS [Syntrophorhabdus sp. PtaB.Bin006]|nr:MAG: EcoKI restriction-modification system protein HsdS [Syntrophorhabdus sp. PtaB.Bin006]